MIELAALGVGFLVGFAFAVLRERRRIYRVSRRLGRASEKLEEAVRDNEPEGSEKRRE